jgi:hypothetical protein
MTYSAVYHGKIFDYSFYETSTFVAHVNDGSNWYYNLMFGHLNLTKNFEHQKSIQGEIFPRFWRHYQLTVSRFVDLAKCDTLNTLFVFVFGSYFVFTVFFLAGMSKVGPLMVSRLDCSWMSFEDCELGERSLKMGRMNLIGSLKD